MSLSTFFRVGLLAVSLLIFATACKSDAATTAEDSNKPLGHLVERYLKPYPDQLSSMAAPNDTALIAAMQAYNAGKYEEAIGLFPNFARNYNQVGYIHLYKGISQLLADKEFDAFQTFQLMRADQAQAMQISNWYMALNYVAFNNVYEARRKLEAIIAANAYPVEEAKALLKELPAQ